MRGLGLSEMAKHPYLIPVFMCCLASPCLGFFTGAKTLLKHPEVYLTRDTIGPDSYRHTRYKLWASAENDAKTAEGCKAPIYERVC